MSENVGRWSEWETGECDFREEVVLRDDKDHDMVTELDEMAEGRTVVEK